MNLQDITISDVGVQSDVENELSDGQQPTEKQIKTMIIEEKSTESDGAWRQKIKTDESSDEDDRDEDFDSDSSFELFNF